MNKLPKFTEVNDPVIKSLIYINDMLRFRDSLKNIKAQAEISGFESIASAKTFKSAKNAVMAELTNNGLIVI